MLDVASVNIVHWRQTRPYMLADDVTADSLEGDTGIVKISGYLRGSNLSANQLIHIPDVGDFQIIKIEGSPDPFPVSRVDDSKLGVLDEADPQLCESLETENEPDLLNNEQTWPTIEELIEADEQRKKKKKLVPKGTSAYQAAWLPSDEEDDDEEGEEPEDDDMEEEKVNGGNEQIGGEGDIGNAGEDSDDSEWEELQDDKSVVGDMSEKSRGEENWEFEFPDEVAAPDDKPARIRFQRYRGLKSYRTSAWDPKENLPLEYGRIFQFASFNRSMKTVLENSKENPVEAGAYITIHIADAPLTLAKSFNPAKPMVLGGLFKYENKISVVHFHITKHTSYTEQVKSKDNLIFHVGMRRFATRPIFSEAAPNCDKQKMVKELAAGVHPIVASIFGPITFPPAPLIVFNPAGDLVATGSLIEVNPDRIITKRIILTGKALKVHKKNAVVREMFYFPEDIEWFKPVDLWTRHGRNGNIKESLGTHGRMKCQFDLPISQADTICMSLYKRCFPKWPEQSYSKQYLHNTNNTTTTTTMEDDDDDMRQ
jgi:pre-rRNA-processing protein TSR1